jgi:hypothetical protein
MRVLVKRKALSGILTLTPGSPANRSPQRQQTQVSSLKGLASPEQLHDRNLKGRKNRICWLSAFPLAKAGRLKWIRLPGFRSRLLESEYVIT